MKQILITNTNNLDNAKILHYCGVITTNVVLGVNFFSDFAASFSDLFGGRSGTYQRKLDGIFDDVLKSLKNKARELDANAIIGLRVDFDEISGKNKQMFMATAIGTACKVEFNNNGQQEQNNTIQEISSMQLEEACMFYKLKKSIENDDYIVTEQDTEYILSHNMTELAPYLIKRITNTNRTEDPINYNMKIETLLANTTYLNQINFLDPYIDSHFDFIIRIIKNNKLFNANWVLSFLENGKLSNAIKLLSISKESYNTSDLKDMEKIVDKLEHLPDKGKIEKKLTGVFSKKEEEIYLCQNSHENSKENTFCNTCGLNIKGLTQNETIIINEFKEKVTILKEILNNNQN